MDTEINEQLKKQLGFNFGIGWADLSASEKIYFDYSWLAMVYDEGRDNAVVALLHSSTRSFGLCFNFKVTPNFIYETDENGNSVMTFDGKNSTWSFFNEATASFSERWEDPVYKALKSVDLVSHAFDGIIEPSASITLDYFAASYNRHFSLRFRGFSEDNVSLQNLSAKIYEFRSYHILGE